MNNRATLREHRAIEDTRYIRRLLEDCDDNLTHAARIAGINRSTFYRLMRHLGMARVQERRGDLMQYRQGL